MTNMRKMTKKQYDIIGVGRQGSGKCGGLQSSKAHWQGIQCAPCLNGWKPAGSPVRFGKEALAELFADAHASIRQPPKHQWPAIRRLAGHNQPPSKPPKHSRGGLLQACSLHWRLTRRQQYRRAPLLLSCGARSANQ